MVVTEDVRKIAQLADVGFDENELEEFTSQCSRILTFFEILDTLPQGSGVDRGLVNIFREDIITPSLSQQEALANASETENGYFKAPRVM
ncbi:MAG: Asp-tRNA(Asn)/Glu-tRNA(Gln) amidotransferase subunit GatC [Methanomicrobiales archaeon HGW-Methanomicrobiales-4]|nr:MAG: Asp-tRNA(Asn)/Glu-tRNA(Gln) amidotransferase subunit GatC [Methanomicrobiales archaeon HGW-Methanomicrobiales-4]